MFVAHCPHQGPQLKIIDDHVNRMNENYLNACLLVCGVAPHCFTQEAAVHAIHKRLPFNTTTKAPHRKKNEDGENVGDCNIDTQHAEHIQPPFTVRPSVFETFRRDQVGKLDVDDSMTSHGTIWYIPYLPEP